MIKSILPKLEFLNCVPFMLIVTKQYLIHMFPSFVVESTVSPRLPVLVGNKTDHLSTRQLRFTYIDVWQLQLSSKTVYIKLPC